MEFEIISKVTDLETIAIGKSIRELSRLRKMYGKGRWRKMKGVATVKLWIIQFILPKFIGMKLME